MEASPITAPREHPLRRLQRFLQLLARLVWARRRWLALVLTGAVLRWVCGQLPEALQAACAALVGFLEQVGELIR